MTTEIVKAAVMPMLLQACPSFQASWDAYVEENYSPNESQLLYMDFAHFAQHLIDLIKRNQLDELPAIFDVIEQLHLYGDAYVKEAATIGLLEDLQNQLLTNELDLNVFNPFLQQQSRYWWHELIAFWQGQTKTVGSSEQPLS